MKEIIPLPTVNAVIAMPGSKSITQRALVIASLADGESRLLSPLASEDTSYTTAALKAMGIEINTQEDLWLVKGQGGRILAPAHDIYLGNNGTATRFLASVAALSNSLVKITGDDRMAERPIKPLLQALNGWGAVISSIHGTGCPPLAIKANGIKGGTTLLPEGRSSQYISSLLLVAPYATQPAELKVAGDILSKPYIKMTMAVMAAFGINVSVNASCNHFTVPQGLYQAQEYQIEGDASSASYFWAAAAITGGKVTVSNIPNKSLQGDTVMVDILEQMGCTVERGSNGITVIGPTKLKGVEVNMGDCPDIVPTLAVVASQAQGRTVISNIAHLRIKECDRLHVMVKELTKLGVRIQELPDSMIVYGLTADTPPLCGAEIETYNDHRIAMSFAVAGLVVPGVKIMSEECVVKSFPDFWQRFDHLSENIRYRSIL